MPRPTAPDLKDAPTLRQPVPAAPPTIKQLREEVQRRELSLAVQELALQEHLLTQFSGSTRSEATFLDTKPEPGWEVMSSGARIGLNWEKGEAPQHRVNLAELRKASYRAWRTSAHGRGILRNVQKFVIGRDFTLDFEDTQRGHWDDACMKLIPTQSEDDSYLTMLWWKDFAKRNKWSQRAKEIVLRAPRDGDVFLRRFRLTGGRITVRFIEPAHVQGDGVGQGFRPLDATDEQEAKKTTIAAGIEYLNDDVETTVAYHVKMGPGPSERVLAEDVIHLKANADLNDLRGIPMLESVLPKLANYELWEQARVLLNRARTAVVLVRKITGATQSQAGRLVSGRLPSGASASHTTAQTETGRREAMFKPGTILTPSEGVDYEFKSPHLEARDAGEDGRRFLLSIAAAVGLPEMLITGDWSNSNFASSVEARTPAVREWEDWQDLIAPLFEQVADWVLSEAIAEGALPQNTSRGVTLRWPPLIHKDGAKETERRERLYLNGILSRTTWSAEEDLVLDDEVQNMRDEAEQYGEIDRAVSAGNQPGPDSPLADDDTDDNAAQPGRGLPRKEAAARGLHAALIALGDLERTTEGEGLAASPHVREAVQRYVESARGVLWNNTATHRASEREIRTVLLPTRTFTAESARRWLRTHGLKAPRKLHARDGWWTAEQWDIAEQVGRGEILTLAEGVQAVVAQRASGLSDVVTAMGESLKALTHGPGAAPAASNAPLEPRRRELIRDADGRLIAVQEAGRRIELERDAEGRIAAFVETRT